MRSSSAPSGHYQNPGCCDLVAGLSCSSLCSSSVSAQFQSRALSSQPLEHRTAAPHGKAGSQSRYGQRETYNSLRSQGPSDVGTSKPGCSSHLRRSADVGVSDSAMWELPWDNTTMLDASSMPLASYYLPQQEATDPLSQSVYQYTTSLSKNAQWWRLLHFFRGHSNLMLSKTGPYTLIGRRNYSKLSFPSRRTYSKLPLPSRRTKIAPSFPLLPDRLTSGIDAIRSWLGCMGKEYSLPLLMLLVVGYWIQGFRCFPWLAVSYHLKDGLQVDPATLQFLQSTVNLPMVAKPIYGIVSDAVYINGARRMPYLMIAGAFQLLSWSTVAINPSLRSSIFPLVGVLVLSNVGAAIAEVVNDAMVAESVQKERGRTKGQLQSFVWLALATGGVMGNLSGGLALSRLSVNAMFTIFSLLIGLQLVTSSQVKEKSFGFKVARHCTKVDRKDSIIDIIQNQAVKLIELVRKPEIMRPLLWLSASYAMIPTLAGSLFFYQTQYLKINPTYLGLAKVVGQLGLLGGGILYNRYFRKSSPRKVLMVVQVLLSICMLSDIVLVSRWNVRVGIPDQFFVLGASAFVEAIGQFKVLPFTVLLTQLCPAGSEGSLLAFFMSCHCLASISSGYLGTILASFLQLSADSFVGLPLGIMIQSVAALIPLLWISCIPDAPNKPLGVVEVIDGIMTRAR